MNKQKKRIRAGRGLGDAIYLHPIVRYLVERGETLEVCTDFPTLYPFPVDFAPWSKTNIQYRCHYTEAKANLSTSQFQDMCACNGLKDVPYRAGWSMKNHRLVDQVKNLASGKPIVLVNAGRQPMDRKDGFGRELLPDQDFFNRALASIKKSAFAVYVGRGDRFWTPDVDLDLNDATSVEDVMDLASIAAGGFTQCGFVIPLMEVFDKPMMIALTKGGRESQQLFIRQLVPEKLCGQPGSTHIYDDWSEELVGPAVHAFCRSVDSCGTLQRQDRSDCR